VLYLAEVQKQKTGFIGAAKAELKLLACQRADQSWNPVSGEEVIPAEAANNLNAGVLVLADLNANRQVQRIQEAGRPLVSLLQNFSRQLEKSKSQEEEIAGWKQSLTYQSQELSRRSMEMEARLEQLQHLEDDFKQLEAQRQEIKTGQEAVERLQTEIERNRGELQGAWEHLWGEQRRLREQQTGFQQSTVLDKATARQIQELLDRLPSDVAPTAMATEQLNLCFEMVATQQGILTQHWQQFEQQRLTAQQQQEEVAYLAQALQNSNQEWQQAQNSLEQASLELQLQKSVLNSKQEYAQMLNMQLRKQKALYQPIYRLAETAEKVNISQIDLEALENMPLNQLQQLVQDLQRDLHKNFHFISDQEEELRLQQQTINELQAQLSQADEDNRINLETELAEEQDRYRMLNETLVGQHQNLRERQQFMSQHQAVLWRRQGIDPGDREEDNKIDFKPIIVQIEAQRQQQTEELQKLEQQISQMGDRIQQAQEVLDHQAHEQEMQRQELHSLEQTLLSLQATTAESWGRVNLYQEMLQPVQDCLDGLRQQLEAIASTLAQVQQSGDHQLQDIAQMRHTLLSIIPSSSLSAS
jgi:chromosome segregation ATPase